MIMSEQKEITKKRKKKRASNNVKTFVVVFILVFGTALITVLNTTGHHIGDMARWHLERASYLSLGNTSLFADQNLSGFADFVLSEEFSAVQQRAIAEDDPQLLKEYVDHSEYRGIQEEAWRHLGDLETTYSMTEVAITECDKSGACWFITSGYDGQKNQGKQFGISFLDGEADENGVITKIDVLDKSTVNSAQFFPEQEYYVMAASKITADSEGRTFWLLCIGDNYTLLMDMLNYAKKMVVFMMVVTAILSLIGMLIMRAGITSPVIRLKKNAEIFAKENTPEHPAEPYHTHIKTNDELEDLSDSLYQLELNVVNTQSELTKISEVRGREKAQLSIATDIQYGVLPNVFPVCEEYDLYAMMRPAREVGGDLYDFFPAGEDHMILVIGDVSDKGIPAALFMMTAKTLLKLYAQMDTDPAKTLEAVNDALVESNPAGMFVTVWIGDLNLKTGVLTAASAGHEYPMFQFGDGRFEVFHDPHGMVLGVMENMSYKNYEIQLKPGDRIFVYSDGAPDAINPEGVHYGLDNLLDSVREAADSKTAKGLIGGVLKAIDNYSKDAPQFDDITMLALDYKPNHKESS